MHYVSKDGDMKQVAREYNGPLRSLIVLVVPSHYHEFV